MTWKNANAQNKTMINKPLSVSIPVNYHTFSGNSEKNHYHELSLTRQTKLNLKQRPCEENPNYSFTTCIKENIADKVTLYRKGRGILYLGRLQAAMGQKTISDGIGCVLDK